MYMACRAPYPQLEPHLVEWALKNLTECAAKPMVCRNMGSYKTMYKMEVAPAAQPAIHGPHSPMHVSLVTTQWSRDSGVCCNHYQLRSPEELVHKYTKGMSMHEYAPVLAPQPQQWYRTVPDVLILQYLPALRQSLSKYVEMTPKQHEIILYS